MYFVRALLDDGYSIKEKVQLLRSAAEKHQQLYRDAMNGKGIDRHLFALYVLCKGLGFVSQVTSSFTMPHFDGYLEEIFMDG